MARIRAEEGRCEGRKPYGYRDGENVVLERLKDLRTAGLAYDMIAHQLNTEGLSPRSGKRWYPAVVRRALLAQWISPSNVAASA